MMDDGPSYWLRRAEELIDQESFLKELDHAPPRSHPARAAFRRLRREMHTLQEQMNMLLGWEDERGEEEIAWIIDDVRRRAQRVQEIMESPDEQPITEEWLYDIEAGLDPEDQSAFRDSMEWLLLSLHYLGKGRRGKRIAGDIQAFIAIVHSIRSRFAEREMPS